MPKIHFDEWVVENLRLTVFPTVDSTFRSNDWWKDVTGVDPDQVSTSAKKAANSVDGTFRDRKLVMRSILDRIDWLLLPTEATAEQAVMNSELASVGRTEEAFQVFSDVVEKWFSCQDLPTISRIAVGAVLYRPIGDHRSAYVELREYIPVDIDPDSSDLIYQINLPHVKALSVNGLELNRLSKWLVVQQSIITLPIGSGGPIAQVTQGPAPASIRLELDINTVPTFDKAIPKENLVSLYRELRDEGRNIVAEGVKK